MVIKDLTEEKVKKLFKGDIVGKEIIFFQSTTSTNDKALEIGQKLKDPEGILVVADAQTRGRGRFGRQWLSPPNTNLYFSLLLKPPFYQKDIPILTLMSVVASASAIREFAGINAAIKWPNDIMVRDKKVGGILTEAKSEGGNIIFVVIGIGINVNIPLNILPKDLRAFTTSLKEEYGRPVDRTQLLGVILGKLEYWYKILLKGNKRVLINEWLMLNSTIGRSVKVQSSDGVISGIAEGIDSEGSLIIRLPSGDMKKVYAGEVTMLKDYNHEHL